MSRITLIIPAYNEELNIRPFFERCMEVEKESEHSLSFLFIDDGSTDGTYAKIEELCKENPGKSIKGIRFSRNFGKESALYAGLDYYYNDYIERKEMHSSSESETGKCEDNEYSVIIDADLQQDPELAITMADLLDNHPEDDVVCCYQVNRKEGAFIKFAKKRFYRIIDRTADITLVEDASDFRMMRPAVVDSILEMTEYNRFSKGIFSWIGFKTHFMPYEAKGRMHGTTKWSFRKLLKYGLDGIIGFSTAPLKLATWLGGFTSVAALIFLIVNIVQTIVRGIEVPGYATIVCLLLIIGGVQMLLLGIIGEYISKMYIETKNRPIYIVKETIESEIKKEV